MLQTFHSRQGRSMSYAEEGGSALAAMANFPGAVSWRG